MAIFNRVLDFFNGDMGPVRPQFQPPMAAQPYVDDVFDPLFNRDVVAYNRELYGPLGAIPAGFAQMWDNALTGQKGILGPGMGILSTFGRSMDKADDFILGGLTEGVNAVGRFVGTNPAPTNPIANIFVEDRDYEGSDLMAAMGNAMGKMAGGVRLDRGDFSDLPDRIQSGFLNLATDPGFMGARLVRENPANRVAAALDSYDNFMAKVAGNTAFPGMQAAARSALDRLNLVLGTTNTEPFEDVVIKRGGKTPSNALPPIVEKMADDIINAGGLKIADDPEQAAFIRDLRRRVDSFYTDEQVDKLVRDNVDAGLNLDTKLAELQTLSDETAKSDLDAFNNLIASGELKLPSDLKQDVSERMPVDEDAVVDEDAAWDVIESELKRRMPDSYEDKLAYYDRIDAGLEDVWAEMFPGVPLNALDRTNSPVYFRTSDIAYQKKAMPVVNEALAIADVNLFNKSAYVRAASRKNAVYAKSVMSRLKRTFKGLSKYLNASHPYQKALKDGDYVPKQFRKIQETLDYIDGKFKKGKADAYSVAKAQFDMADVILANQKYFNDADGTPFVQWARDVDSIRQTASSKVFYDENARSTANVLSYDEDIGVSKKPTLPKEYVKDYKDSIAFLANRYMTVTKDIKTVKDWDDFQTKAKLPDTLELALGKGQSLEASDAYVFRKKTPQEAKALAIFSKLDPNVENVWVSSWDNKLNVPFLKQERYRVFTIDKGMLDDPDLKDSVFLSNFIVLNRNKYSQKYHKALKGEYPRLSSSFGLWPGLAKLKEGEKLRLAYDPIGKDYLAGIEYDPRTISFRITSQDTLDLFSTRNVKKLPKEMSMVRREFLDTFDPTVVERKIRHENILRTYKSIGGMDVAKNIFKDASPETVARFVEEPGSLATMQFEEMGQQLTQDFRQRFGISDDMPHDEFIKKLDEYGTPDEIRLSALVDKTVSIDAELKRQSSKVGVIASKGAKDALEAAERLKKKDTVGDAYDGRRFVEAQKFRWEHEDQIIPGDDFIDYFRRSQHGVIRIGLTDGDAARYDGIKSVLTHNVDKVNSASKHGNLLKLNEFDVDGAKFIEVGFDYDNPKVKGAAKTFLGGLFPKSLDLEDVVVQRASTLPETDDIREYMDLFRQIEDVAQPIYRRMGGTAPQSDWTMHVVSDSPVGRSVFTKINDASGYDLGKGSRSLRAMDKIVGAPNVRGKLGVPDYRRSFLGDFDAYKGGFTDDPVALAKHSFSDGVMQSVYTNTVHEYFFNNQLRIQDWFDSPESLAEAFRVRNSAGKRAGNLSGFVLVTPTMKDGVLTGIRRYDPLSDADVAKAFDDPHAVMLPNSCIVSIERLLKKDHSLIYKPTLLGRFANYVHHYASIPIKFGILSNLGFLAGNVQDAYFKQAETMAKAYGTTIEDELVGVAMAYRHMVDLESQFSDVFELYTKALLDKDTIDKITGSAEETERRFGKTISVLKQAEKLGTSVDPAEILNNPKYFKEWNNFISLTDNKWFAPDSHEMKVARLYTFLMVRQNTATFENNTLDLADVYDASRLNEYDTPENLFDRVLYGDPSSEYFTYGLMLNNPFSNWVLRKSNGFESFTRSASIINALMHQGWTDEKIAEVLGGTGKEYEAMRTKLSTDSINAVNLMHHSNFDYENVTSFMNGASKIMPFPTFYIKNLSHWADTFAEHPEMLDDIISFHEGLWQNKDTSEDEFAAQAKGRGAYPLGGKTPFGTGIVKQTPINSMFSAFSAVNNLKEDAAYRINPLARPLTRHLQKREDVKYRPYSTDPYEKNVKMGDPGFSDLAYMFHQLNPYDRFLNTYLRTPRKVATNSYQASDFLPSVFQPDFGKKSRK